MDRVRHLGPEYMIVAILHDLLEDCPEWTSERLIDNGFPIYIVDALDLLNHDKKNVPYHQYVMNLSTNVYAREVKLRDLEHNSKITRLKGITDKDTNRIKKYNKAYLFLKSVDSSIQSV